MSRVTFSAWMLVILAASLYLYRVKYEVQELHTKAAETARQLELEKEALHVVAAEWAYLNRPDRLQTLANKYLATTGVTADHIAEIEAIPFPKQSIAQNDGGDIHPVSAHVRAGE